MNEEIKLAKIGDRPEIFYSVQGEGRNIGQPSIFLRLSLCNLHCTWCDTDYTWNWVGVEHSHEDESRASYKKYVKKEQILKLSVLDTISLMKDYDCKNIVLTGGEPMFQQKSLTELARELRKVDKKYFFEIETNGTFLPTPEFDTLIDQYNISPKMGNSGNNRRLREKREPLEYFSASKKSNFKFVVKSRQDIDEILDFVERYKVRCEKIYLMPEGRTEKQLNKKSKWICFKYKFYILIL